LYYDDTDVVPRNLYPIWKACALTCHAMTPRSQYWLFHRIVLSKQSQADSLMQVLRRNPKVAQYTRRLAISGPSNEENGQKWSWISCIPLLLAPRMTNLHHLYLEGVIFLQSHPSFSRALAAFKSIRRLTLYSISFSTFGHCFRLMQVFPHLDHFSGMYLQWERPSPGSSHSHLLPNTRRGKSPISHLDLWSNLTGGADLNEFTNSFIRVQDNSTLRTLSLYVQSNDLIQDVLRCGFLSCSVYLMLGDDGSISGFENLAHLQTLHVKTSGYTFPIQAISSIILSATSQRFRSLIVYTNVVEEEGGDGQGETQQTEVLDAYQKLDDVLCNQALKGLELTIRLFGASSVEDVLQRQQKLHTLLPKFRALERLRVEHTPTELPHLRWLEYRDGF